jgi:hypothetical protein
MRVLSTLTLALCLIAPAASGFQERPDTGRLEELRRRWEAKSSEERELLRRRFEELKELPPADRDVLARRARRFEELRHTLREEATEEDRRRFDALPPHLAEERWRARAFEHSRETGRRFRDMLPPDVRTRLEEAPPGERRRVLEGVRSRERDHRSRRAIRELGHRLGLDRETVEGLEALPHEERMREVMRLKRRHIENRIAERGLPDDVDTAHWEELRRLPDDEFFRRGRHFLFGERRGPRPPGPRGDDRWQDRQGPQPERFDRPPGRRGDRPSDRKGERGDERGRDRSRADRRFR